MGQEKMLNTLMKLGLTNHEAKCYLALLERDTLSAPEVQRLADIPRPNAYQALDTLLQKGYCITTVGKTKQFKACDPQSINEMYLEKLTEEKKEVSRVLKELEPLYKRSAQQKSPLDYINIISNPHQVHTRFMKLIEEAEEEILAFVKPPYSGPSVKLSEQGSQAMRAVLSRMQTDGRLAKASMVDVLRELLTQNERLDVLYVAGHWLDVDDAVDLARAREFP